MSLTNYKLSGKKRTNLSISEALLLEAKAHDINVSNAAEAGIRMALVERKKSLWLQENQKAIESSNNYVSENGLPLYQFRNF
jgi:antitoxin CcdA